MRSMYILIGIFIVFLLAWFSWGFFTSYNLETPEYTVIETVNGYEVRAYEPYLIAQVTVEGAFSDAINEGFRILAGYIFGGNTARESIAMTAPVTEQESVPIAMTAPVLEQESVAIAMTAPVTEQQNGQSRTVAFVVPREFTLETLPVPDDDRVTFVEVPGKKMVAMSFTWYAREARVEQKKAAFLEAVVAAGLEPLAPPIFASYNDPFTFPLLQKHEILIEIK